MLYHEPVLLKECIDGLNVQSDGIYVDVTFGGGGHTKSVLNRLDNGKVFAFDQDEDAIKNTINDNRLILIHQNFRYLKNMLRVNNVQSIDGLIADLGVSSFQIDTSARGFSHRFGGPLDMRMDKRNKISAAAIINSYDENQLQKIFSEYGELRNAKTLAQIIVSARNQREINTIEDLMESIQSGIRGNSHRYLSQLFQALRIAVNGELEALKAMLMGSKNVLKSGGRLAVISYHSLEDRIVKNFIRTGNTEGELEKDDFGTIKKYFEPLNKKPITPGKEELIRNPRSRSARLRIAEKI
ncbi:MAG: 16S rRNA (cytosine(1402)-N(4))-methyltransferase RsmH [Chitinophagales bacterium]|nr:16S rRNA (cytosine(1402)-N(4))-methyltransferase RsmH [Chitinophagales bacterium]